MKNKLSEEEKTIIAREYDEFVAKSYQEYLDKILPISDNVFEQTVRPYGWTPTNGELFVNDYKTFCKILEKLWLHSRDFICKSKRFTSEEIHEYLLETIPIWKLRDSEIYVSNDC